MLTCTKHCGGFCRISLKDIADNPTRKMDILGVHCIELAPAL